MRTAFIYVIGLSVALSFLVGCNSHEGVASRAQVNGVRPAQTPVINQQPVHNPADDARRITAEDLHKLWEKQDVLIVDTRTEAAYNQSHIKGAILVPANEFATRVDELSKHKMIVTYCT